MQSDPTPTFSATLPENGITWRTYLIAIALILAIGMGLGSWAVLTYGKQWFGTGDSVTRPSEAQAAQSAPQLRKDGSVIVPSAQPALPLEFAPRAQGVQSQLDVANSQAARAEALLVSVAARRALDRGLSLGYIEPLLISRFGGSQPKAVETIIAVSQKPITIEALRNRLEALEPQLLGGGSDTSGFWGKLRRELGQLVVLRKADSKQTLPSEHMARALRLMDAGRMDAAILEVEELAGKKIAPRWLDDARRYNEARRALDVIETAALVEQRSTNE
jgi:hypothetical protein